MSDAMPDAAQAGGPSSAQAVVYGWRMAPTAWPLALLVWAYALVSFLLASGVKIAVYGLLQRRAARRGRHPARGERTACPLPDEGPCTGGPNFPAR